MKKLLLFGLAVLLVVGLGIYITLQFFLGSAVKTGVNRFGPAITQTPVQLDGARVSPFSGVGTLNGLTVGNPQGWSNNPALQLGRMHIDLEPSTLFDDHIVINEITIEQPQFRYETRLVASNVGDLLKNIEQSIGTREAQPQTKTGKPIKMVVKKLSIREGQVTVEIPGATAIAISMPPVELADIGTAEGGITPAQLASAVMREVTTKIVAVATEAVAGASAGNARELATQAAEALRGAFGGRKKQPAPANP
jgi:uncharacterized protein involved in outer membrane biogenesis